MHIYSQEYKNIKDIEDLRHKYAQFDLTTLAYMQPI